MTLIDRLIDRVLRGESPRHVYESAMCEDDQPPAWKPGEPVPKGYIVVFGKLVHSSKRIPGAKGLHARNAHELVTQARHFSALANQKSKEAKSQAGHMIAHTHHEDAKYAVAMANRALTSLKRSPERDALAAELNKLWHHHKDAEDAHYKHADYDNPPPDRPSREELHPSTPDWFATFDHSGSKDRLGGPGIKLP